MQRLHLVLLCSFVIATSPARSWAQNSATTCYVGLDGGVLGLNLPGFEPFQRVNAGEHVRFLDTDSGNGVGALYGGRIGWTLYEPTTFNGFRIEARGFFSERDTRSQYQLPAGTVVNLLNPPPTAIVFGSAANADSRHQVKVTSGEMLFKWDMAASNSLIVSPYAGLSVLDIDQRFSVTAIAGAQRMSLHEDVRGSYWGGSAGIEVLTRIFPTTILSVDAGVSLFDFSADRNAQQTNTAVSPANMFVNESTGHAAFAANLRFELSQELRWCQLVVFGGAHFLDTVPEVVYGKLLNVGSLVQPSRLDVGEAVGLSGGLSLRIPF